MQKLKPLGNNLLLDINEDKAEQKTSSGIIIPESAKKKPTYLKVLGVGPEVKEVSEGDLILVDKFSGQEIEFEENKYLFIPEEKAFGKIEKV